MFDKNGYSERAEPDSFLEVTKRTVADSGTVRVDFLDDHFPVESRRHQTYSYAVVFG